MEFLKGTAVEFRFDEGEGRITPAANELWLAFTNDIGACAFSDWLHGEGVLEAFQAYYEENKYLYRG